MQTRLSTRIYFYDASTLYKSAVRKWSRLWPLGRLCHCLTPPRAWCRIATGAMGCFVKLLSPTIIHSRLCVCRVLLRHCTCLFYSLYLLSGCRYVVLNCSIAVACVWRGSARVVHVPWQPSVTRLPSQRCNTVVLLPQAHLSPCRHIVVLEPCPEQAGNRRQGLGRLLRRSNRQRWNATAVRQCRAAQLHMLQGLRVWKPSKASAKGTGMPSCSSTLRVAVFSLERTHMYAAANTGV